MKRAKQILVVLLANLVLLFLLLETNSFLAPWGIYLTLGGLLIVYPSLKLPFEQGVVSVFLTGLCWDALTPVPFGFFALLLSTLCVAMYQMRHRLRSKRKFYLILTAFVANLIVLAVCSIFFGQQWLTMDTWVRFALELLLSQTLLFALGYWFLELQENSLILLGGTPTADDLSVS